MCVLEIVIYEIDVFFCIFYPILPYIVLYDIVCILNAHVIFVLHYQDIEEIKFGTFPESIFKEGIKLLIQSIKKKCAVYPQWCTTYLHQ